jgi:predicted Zn-dependent protease
MRRTALIAALLVLYGAVWLHGVFSTGSRRGFDPFAPRARTLAERLEAGYYRDALSLVHELNQEFPGEPELLRALARIRHGLREWTLEAEAWEQYVRVSPSPAEACPALAEAYQAGNQDDRALHAYERCARFDPDDPDRWFDLAQAYERRGRRGEELTVLRRAAVLDPGNPWVEAAIARPSGGQ